MNDMWEIITGGGTVDVVRLGDKQKRSHGDDKEQEPATYM